MKLVKSGRRVTGCIVDKRHHFKQDLFRLAIMFDFGYEVVTKLVLKNGSCYLSVDSELVEVGVV